MNFLLSNKKNQCASRLRAHVKKSHNGLCILNCNCSNLESKICSKVYTVCYKKKMGGRWVCNDIQPKQMTLQSNGDGENTGSPSKANVIDGSKYGRSKPTTLKDLVA